MGKIPVQELAKMMGISNQDLVFKLRSIGVRVEGDNAHIDTDIISAILQGKKLPHPREVILRDEPAPNSPAGPVGRRPGRRMPPANPLRPNRPRTLIQKADSRIASIPVTEKPEPKKKPEPKESTDKAAAVAAAEAQEAEAAAAEAKARAAEKAAEVKAAVAKAEEPKETTAQKAAEAKEPEKKAAAAEPKKADTKKAEKTAKAAPRAEREAPDEKKTRRKKPIGRRQDEREIAAYKDGGWKDEEDTDTAAPAKKPGARRKRREERRKAASERGAGAGKALPMREGAEEMGPVMITEGMTIRDFAEKTGVKAKDLIKSLFQRGIMANINHVLEPELAEELAAEMGLEAMQVSFEEEVQLKQEMVMAAAATGDAGPKVPRAPVVTIMGHVDHGKTSLLDAIRSSQVAEGEHGGITQHIGAYRVEEKGRAIVFLDTPGHEAFTMMRARGARVTDIVVLMVAADDGVMPQTIEAINHARAAEVPMVVALNKIDKENANIDRVKKQLADQNLLVEDWGGDVVAVPMSAKNKEGIDELLEMLALTADLQELKSTPELPAQGTVLEARKDVGRGIVATVLVQDGSLEVGDIFVTGATWGRVRAMNDDLGQRIKKAGPSTPVEVTGFSDVPDAGDLFQVVADEARARTIADFRAQEQRRRDLAPTSGKVSLEQLFSQIEEGEVKELPVVLKADVQGSVEVLKDALEKASTDKVKVKVIMFGVGAISTNDVLLASASEAVVVGFNVRPERNALDLAEKEEVDLRLHTVIYEVLDELKKAMEGLLEPVFQEVTKGRAEVRETFKVPKIGVVAGCHVVEGTVPRSAQVRLLRDNVVAYDGKIASLRRFKEDVSEVRTGFDCGIGLERFQDVKPGDIIEAYVREEVAPTL